MPQFEATIKHLAGDLKTWGAAAAVKNIEGWEEKLKTVEVPGSKGIASDLEKLKKQLQADKPDGQAIQTLLGKLGTATATIAKKVENATGDRLASLGEAVTKAGH